VKTDLLRGLADEGEDIEVEVIDGAALWLLTA